MSEHDLLVTSGVGPEQARRFVVQLANRFEQLAESRALVVRAVELHGDAAAPRSAVLHLAGDASLLADELGTHVLVQRNLRGRHARKRFFAGVSLCAPVVATTTPELAQDELVITACRAGGPGGQHVNKVATAVRVQHVPTGIAVRCASERSQRANLAHALRRLAAALAERAAAGRDAAIAARRTAQYRVERGRAIRSYFLDADGALHELD